jgi:hypothetical protein
VEQIVVVAWENVYRDRNAASVCTGIARESLWLCRVIYVKIEEHSLDLSEVKEIDSVPKITSASNMYPHLVEGILDTISHHWVEH